MRCDATAAPAPCSLPARWSPASRDGPVRRFTRRCYNATLGRRTCICSRLEVDGAPARVYGPGSAPRLAYRYPCADVVKYKANWARNRSLVLTP